jgi:5-methyltetrahydrofolate--homocysteine methyltransferase
MSRFLEALHSGRVLLMDGAMGTELQRAGIGEGECYELWNRTQPERVRAIHRSYVYAGARCLVTNTFQANPAALAKHGLQEELEEINQAAIGIARSVCGVNHYVLASVGPMEPGLDALDRVVQSLRMADAILFETWSDELGLILAGRVWQEARKRDPVPVLLSVAFQRGLLPRTFRSRGGLEPETVAFLAQEFAVDALGVNCGRDIGMDEVVAIVRQYRRATDLPLFVRPNAGTPTRIGERWLYPQTPEKMAARLPELLEAGIGMIGGCCGTTPEHIAAFRPLVDAWNARHHPA